MSRRMNDAGVSTVVGAILVLAVVSLAVLYVNAVHVPHQGAAIETAGREAAEASLTRIAARLGDAQDGPLAEPIPLKPPRADPPLLSGVVLTPVRTEGRLEMDPGATRLRVSHVTAGTASPDDPMRVDLGGGLVRVYDLGNATRSAPLGALRLTTGGAYLDPITHVLEGGALLGEGAGRSTLLSPPGLAVGSASIQGSPTTSVSWRIPLLRGEAVQLAGPDQVPALLNPGPLAQAGGGQLVHHVTLEVETTRLAAWRAALEDALGDRGTLVATPGDEPDAGLLVATILPPAGTPEGVAAVSLDLSAVRYEVLLTSRSGV